MRLTSFFVKNYQFTLVLLLMIIAVSLATILTMPRAEDPEINPPQFPIIVVYPGTSPRDMEELVSENAAPEKLKYYADALKDELEKVSALKKVEYWGVPEQVVRVDLKLDKIAQLKIPVNLVLGSIQSEAANIPGGSVRAGTKTF